jgi:hypothetical protein
MTQGNPIVGWIIDLQGSPSALSIWGRHFALGNKVRVECEEIEGGPPRYYLYSSRFNGVSDSAIWGIAGDLIDQMNGIAKIVHSGEPVTRGLPIAIRADGSRSPMKQIFSVTALPMATFAGVGDQTTGDQTTGEPTMPAIELLALADDCPDFSRALLIFAKPDDWFDIYIIWEIIHRAVGRKVTRWIGKEKFDSIRRNANYHRHAYPQSLGEILTLSDARDRLRSIMYFWATELAKRKQ